MRCATHPEVETSLRCGKCGKPICPRCLVQTPVGARCPDCARLHKLPTFEVSAKYYLRAVGAGLGVAILCGLVWGVVIGLMPYFYLNFLLAPGAGYVIGEIISLVANRKRSLGLIVIGGAAVIISYVVSIFCPWGTPLVLVNILYLVVDFLALALGIFVAVTRLR